MSSPSIYINPATGKLESLPCKFNWIDWKLVVTPTHKEGRMHWDDDAGTLELGLKGGVVKLQVGQEVHLPDRPKNNQGSQIGNGKVVYLSGATGAVPEVKLANASETSAPMTLAVATEDIADQQRGYYTTFGVVREIDTSFGSDGDEVFLDTTDGGLTTDKLNHPNFRVKIGYIIRSHATEGVLFVNINVDNWLKRFQAQGEPTGFDRNLPDSMGDISFDVGTRTFTIEPKAGEDYFSFWSNAREFRKTTAQTVTITDTEGLWFIYYNTDGTLESSQVAWDFVSGKVFVAILYWDATNKTNLGLGEERHGISMDAATHEYLHEHNGAVWESGFTPSVTIGTGSSDADCEIQSVSTGVFDDEDIELDSIEQTSDFIMLYKDGANANFRKLILGNALVDITGTRPNYNEYTGGAWTRTEVGNTKFTLTHLFVTNSVMPTKSILVMGENQYNSRSDAQDGAKIELTSLVTGALPTPEFIAVATFIIECKDAFTNSYNARVALTDDGGEFIDFRTSEKTGVGAVATDHGNLSGLLEDDHTQYSLVDGTRDFTGVVGGITPTIDAHLTTKSYVDTADDLKLDLDGGNANQDINIGSYDLTATELTSTGKITVGVPGISFTAGTGTSQIFDDGVDLWLTSGASLKTAVPFISSSTLEIAGQSLFKDKIKFTQTDGNEFIDSLADGYMDYGATTQHRFDNGIDVDGDITADNFAGDTEILTAGENLVAGNVCYLKSDGKYWKAKGDAEATTAGRIVLANATISADATGLFIVRGNYTDTGLTAGATYFISTSTAGEKVTTDPTTGNFARVIGWATTTTNLYFNPSKDYIEVG